MNWPETILVILLIVVALGYSAWVLINWYMRIYIQEILRAEIGRTYSLVAASANERIQAYKRFVELLADLRNALDQYVFNYICLLTLAFSKALHSHELIIVRQLLSPYSLQEMEGLSAASLVGIGLGANQNAFNEIHHRVARDIRPLRLWLTDEADKLTDELLNCYQQLSAMIFFEEKVKAILEDKGLFNETLKELVTKKDDWFRRVEALEKTIHSELKRAVGVVMPPKPLA